MEMMNKVFLIGSLVNAPELNINQNGVAVVDLKLTASRKYRNHRDEITANTFYFSAKAFEKQAEICCKHLIKGSPVFIEGVFGSVQVVEDDEVRISTEEIRIEKIQFMNKTSAKIEKALIQTTLNMPSDLSE